MAYEFRLPDIGEGVAEGEVVQWFVQEGGVVREDAPLVSVLTDKANVEIPSPKSGTVVKIHAQVGEKVKVGGLLVTIEAGGGTPAPVPRSGAAPSPPARAAGTPAPAPARPAAPASAPATETAPPSAPAAPSGSAVPTASPMVRRLALERGIDLRQVRGTGPGGRVTEADLTAAAGPAAAPPPAAAAPRPTSAAPGPAVLAPASEGSVERIPIRGLRRVIAEHMAQSVHTAAHFTYVEEVDVSELVRLRERMAKHIEKDGVKLSYLPFVIKGVVSGLKAYPRLNATMDDARNELVVHADHHIGIAAAAPDGLIVPVIHHAGAKSLRELAREIQELAERGRAGKLDRASLTGSTFTITSLGALGGVLATPILNYPEVAILGVHKIARRPVYRADGSVGPADLMNLSISLDHRVIDGYEGAQFLASVKAFLEDPHQLFAELR